MVDTLESKNVVAVSDVLILINERLNKASEQVGRNQESFEFRKNVVVYIWN